MSNLVFSFILLVNIVNVCLCQFETVTVSINQGELRGKVNSTLNGIRYYSFEGIPFAKPPVGELRFKGPRPAEPWNGTLDAFELGPMCPQLDFFTQEYMGDEDCLSINVYTSLIPENDSDSLKPVMVYIYGGGFFIGSASQMTGADFLLENDVIVVTMNYRVGPFGFLSTGDTVIPGNNGLKDQVLALRWVQENIKTFGGNPDQVTIFGVSAGGCSVHHLVLSPLGAGLFHNAIAQSGSAIDQWGCDSAQVARTKALKLCEVLGSPTNDSNEVAEFLKSLSSEKITAAVTKALDMEKAVPTIFYRPTIEQTVEGEEVFIAEPPINIIRAGKFNQVPFMSGTVSQEGTVAFVDMLLNPSQIGTFSGNPQTIVPEDLLPYLSEAETIALAQEIWNFYFGDNVKTLSMKDFVHLLDMGADLAILYGVNRHVDLHAAVSTRPVYQYEFSFDGRFGTYKTMLGDLFPGVGHGGDTDYLFYNSIYDYSEETEEIITLKRMVKLWTNFAKTGNPTPDVDPLLQNITIQPVTSIDRFYLDIGNDLKVKRNLHNDRMAFWEDIYVSISG